MPGLVPDTHDFIVATAGACKSRHAAGRAQVPITTRYLYIASMDVRADKEDLFNEVYDTEHVPNLLKVPGVRAVTRARAEPFSISVGGKTSDIPLEGPTYHAMYEIESPQVLTSTEWGRAVDAGRWPTEVRPFCSNRRYTMMKIR
jgi:hypothetical protein